MVRNRQLVFFLLAGKEWFEVVTRWT